MNGPFMANFAMNGPFIASGAPRDQARGPGESTQGSAKRYTQARLPG